MGDRFPLFALGGLLLLGILGSFLMKGAARGSFADTLSTYRSEKDGARALYLLAAESGLRVERVQRNLEVIDPSLSLVLLAVEWSRRALPILEDEDEREESPRAEAAEEAPLHSGMNRLRAEPLTSEEQEKVLEHLRAGATLVYVLWDEADNDLLQALEVYSLRADQAGGMRTLVPAQPTPYTLEVERVEAPVRVYLELPEGAVPLLLDEQLGHVAAGVVPYGQGRVILIGAPALAMNEALARADNAQFWLSLLTAAQGEGRLGFDEFHHGFTSNRSIAEFAARYGLQFAAAQLLLGLLLWAGALRRFGRPRTPAEDIRVGATDALFATSRLYREGRHYTYAAQLLVRGVTQALASHAGLSTRAEAAEVAGRLAARGREDLAQLLLELVRAAGIASSESSVQALAEKAAQARQRVYRVRPPRHHPGPLPALNPSSTSALPLRTSP